MVESGVKHHNTKSILLIEYLQTQIVIAELILVAVKSREFILAHPIAQFQLYAMNEMCLKQRLYHDYLHTVYLMYACIFDHYI